MRLSLALGGMMIDLHVILSVEQLGGRVSRNAAPGSSGEYVLRASYVITCSGHVQLTDLV